MLSNSLFGQRTGTLKGTVIDKETEKPVIGATIVIVGTYKAIASDAKGAFQIDDIPVGDYTVKVSSVGYQEQLISGVTIYEDEETVQNIKLQPGTISLEEAVVIGDPTIVDLEGANTEVTIDQEDIQRTNTTEVQELVALQNGVSQNPDGLQIRGGRVYETQYVIDGVNAQDPLSGTGFGLDVSTNAVRSLRIVTGGVDAAYGDGSSGLVDVQIREGGDHFQIGGSWTTDNLGFIDRYSMGWNTNRASVTISTPLDKAKKLSLFTAINVGFTDHYFGPTADQLYSSLLNNEPFWSPFQQNHWENTVKLTYQPNYKTKISITNQHSLNVSQNTRSLQIIGNDEVVRPGFQYFFSLNLDNANTYTHRSNLTAINVTRAISDQWFAKLTLGRLFTNLRADANGRPFRYETIDRVFDARSIVTDPVTVFNPEGEVVFVNPGPGLANNGGIADLWHDHYVSEHSWKLNFNYRPNNKVHYFNFGWQGQLQTFQWADVTKPWIGAPIQLSDSVSTPSTSVGASSEIWKASPFKGGFYVTDQIKYHGIIATLGLRYNYWAPGKYLDNAVEDPNTLIQEQSREDYRNNTFGFMGYRMKSRLLPRLNVSFPVTANNVLYFNYGHAMRLPHPRFLYAGLDPTYLDRSFLSSLGNPDLDPELTISYEAGIKSQLSKDVAFTITAFYNDKYDYIVTRTATVKDPTGRFVEKTFRINQDYARIRGIELGIRARKIKKYFYTTFNFSYQIAQGKSNSARESLLAIRQNGFANTTRETYLAWDRPVEIKWNIAMITDSTFHLFGKPFNHYRLIVFATYRSGMRYTPHEQNGTTDLGRPIWEPIQSSPFSEVGSAWFWIDCKLQKSFPIKEGRQFISTSVEVKNVTNHLNAQIINPVTGRGYQDGDPLPLTQRNPVYEHPQDNGIPPFNPARWLQPRQLLFGLNFTF